MPKIKQEFNMKLNRYTLKLNESTEMEEQESLDMFKDRFGALYKSFYDAFKQQSLLKFNETGPEQAEKFINMVDLIQPKVSNIQSCEYNQDRNRLVFKDMYGKNIAYCDCKDGWYAHKLYETFGLHEDVNSPTQISISFPLLVTYECENHEITKKDINNFEEHEKDCIQQYSDQVIQQAQENTKFINETLDVYNFELKYNGYDDNYNAFFILTVNNDSVVDENIIKAFRRYFSKEFQIQFSEDVGEVVLTATPVTSSNTNFTIETLEQ